MTDTTIEPVQKPAFKNRSAGLVAFGVFLLLGSFLAFLMSAFIPLSLILSNYSDIPGAVPINLSTMIPGIIIYVLIGVLFATLGVGSILARRWARSLILVFSWLSLICGIFSLFSVLSLSFLFKDAFSGQDIPNGVLYVILAFIFAFYSLFLLVIPSIFIFFYRSPHVKATCEFKDPKERWTDRCPLPVIALMFVLGMWIFGLFSVAFSNWVFPLFGLILNGYPGMMVVIPLIILACFIIYGVYHLRLWAWWATLFFLVFWFISFSVTFYFIDFTAYYEAMGYSVEMIKLMERSADTIQSFFFVIMPFYAIIPVGFLLFVRKYFNPISPPVTTSHQ